MDYLKQKILIQQKIKALQEHLGLGSDSIKRDLEHGYDDEFLVDFGYSQKSFPVEVINDSELKDNELAGYYTKITNSNFHFRWL